MKNLYFFLLAICLTCVSCMETNTRYPRVITPVLIAQGELYGNGQESITKQNLVIRTQEEWDNLLNAMNSVNNVSNSFAETEIDFNSFMVIAVFDEVRGNSGCSINISNIIEYIDKIIVDVHIVTATSGADVMNQPFYIVKIPVIYNNIVFDYNVSDNTEPNDTIPNDISDILNGNKFKLSNNLLNSSDDFFFVKFGETTLEGRTICNTFSANYEVVDNKVNITNFVSTSFEEKDLFSKDFLALFSDSFDYHLQDDNLTVSNATCQMSLENANENEEILFYYYFVNSVFMELDTFQLYLKTVNPISDKSDLIALFQPYNFVVDTAKSYFFDNFGSVAFSNINTASQYKELLKIANNMSNVKYSTPCVKSSGLFMAWTNGIMVSTELSETEIKQILTALYFPAYNLEDKGSYWYITITEIETGFEPLHWTNVLYNLSNFNYATINWTYLQNLINF